MNQPRPAEAPAARAGRLAAASVALISALTVTLFLGGWNAPFAWPWPVDIAFDPSTLGVTLLILVAVLPLALTLAFAAPFWLASSRIKGWVALVIGFVLANLFGKKARTWLTLLSVVMAFLLFGLLQSLNQVFSAGAPPGHGPFSVVVLTPSGLRMKARL